MHVGHIKFYNDFLLVARFETFFGNRKTVGELFACHEVLVFGKVIFESHQV